MKLSTLCFSLRVEYFRTEIDFKMLIKSIISYTFFLFGILSQTDLEIHYHKNNLKLNILYYNGQTYLSMNELSKIFILNDNIKYYDYYLKFQDEELIFSDLSFFVVYRSGSQMRVGQMSHPAIKIRGELHVPIQSFFQSMNSLNLINSKIINDQAIDIIDYSIFEKPIAPIIIEKKVLDLNEKKTKKKNKILDTIYNNFKFDEKQNIERGKYVIPRSIKK